MSKHYLRAAACDPADDANCWGCTATNLQTQVSQLQMLVGLVHSPALKHFAAAANDFILMVVMIGSQRTTGTSKGVGQGSWHPAAGVMDSLQQRQGGYRPS